MSAGMAPRSPAAGRVVAALAIVAAGGGIGWVLWALDDLAAWTIAVGIACNIPCAILGCYLVLRRMSLLGDAISHAVLPGIVIGFLVSGAVTGPAILVGAMAFGVLTAFLTQSLATFGKVPEDASMGVVFTSLFAVGVLLITNYAAQVDLDPGCVLYGMLEFAPVYTVEMFGHDVPRALVSLLPAGVATLVFVALFWKELKVASFDPALATAMGFSSLRIHYMLMAMVAVVTVAAFEAVGSILVVAMLIVPAAAAHLLTDRLGVMMVLAAAVGVASAFGGYAGAVALDTSAAGMMAVAAGSILALTVLFAPRHGLLSRALHTLGLSLRIAGEDVVARFYRAEEQAGAAANGNTGPGVVALDWRDARRAAGGGLIGRMALLRLRLLGSIRPTSGGRAVLTESGRRLGRGLVRSHRLWETFLSTELGLPTDHLHEPAERIEHFIGPTLQAELQSELDRPTADPHGRSIPRRESGSGPPGR